MNAAKRSEGRGGGASVKDQNLPILAAQQYNITGSDSPLKSSLKGRNKEALTQIKSQPTFGVAQAGALNMFKGRMAAASRQSELAGRGGTVMSNIAGKRGSLGQDT